MNTLALALLVCLGPADDDLRCLDAALDKSRTTLVYAALQRRAVEMLEARRQRVEGLVTADQIHEHQRKLQALFRERLGGLPPRTPLDAKVVGKLDGQGFRIEKVMFQSRPQHHVTALLYLPASPPPFPAVVVASGHSRTGKSAGYNQRYGIALARHGMAALCYDPVGQGERSQILDANGQPLFSSTTQEHFLMGIGSILIGANTAQFRVWDGMRAIDYLESRAEIDAGRIGFTGCSGGGTVTSYVMALDQRVRCAAPACYLTTLRRLVETIGPQDAEQNIFGQIQFGMDHPDYVLMRAPRPTLISATTGDFFDIRGTWENYREANRSYTRLGFPERVALVEADGKHGVQPANLVAIVRWMRRWLLDKDDPVVVEEIQELPPQQLLCTAQGQVLLLPGEKSVFDLNVEDERQLQKQRQQAWKDGASEALRDRVRAVAGVRPLTQIEKPEMTKSGRVHRDGYHIDKLVLHAADGVPIPVLTYHPPDPKADAYLYVHGQGKHADGGPGGPIEKLVADGYVVVAADLRGFGETAPAQNNDVLGDWKTYFLAYLLGESMVGKRAEDVLACARWVANYQTDTPRAVHLIGIGEAALPALHAAALEPDAVASVRLQGAPASWSEIVGQRVARRQLTGAIHGALRVYDLPDLIESLGDKLR